MKINIEYEVTTSFVLTVDRLELPEDHDELLESVTRDELCECPIEVHELEWSHLKEAWRSADTENTWVTDDKGNELYEVHRIPFWLIK